MHGRFGVGEYGGRRGASRRLVLSSAMALCGLLAASPFARFNTDDPAAGGGSGGGSGGGTSTPTVEDLQRQLATIQGQLGTLTTERDELGKKVKGFEDSQKTETQKQADALAEAQRKATEAETTTKSTTLRLHVEREARKIGFHDEDIAFRLLDTSAVTFDKDGKPTNVTDLLQQLVKDKPFLAAAEGTGGAGGSGGGSGMNGGNGSNPARPRGGALTLEQIGNMSTAEINANWPAVQVAMAAAK